MNKNEREWYQVMIDEMNERVATQMKLPPDHPVMLDLKEMIQDVAELFIGEAEKRERTRMLEECREVVKKHSTENAHILTPVPSTCLKILSRLDSLDKMG